MSISEKKREEKFYAFTLERVKEKSYSNQKSFNQRNSNKGFYDDLIAFDKKIKNDKLNLNESKSKGIKESVYSNIKIPDVWKNKINYQSDLYKTINNDHLFLTYLGKGGKEFSSPDNLFKKSRKRNQQIGNFKKFSLTNYNTSFNDIKPQKSSFKLNETDQSNTKSTTKKNIFNNSKDHKDIVYEEGESIDYKEKKIKDKKEEHMEKQKAYLNSVKTVEQANKEILGILKEYKHSFPISLPKIKKHNIIETKDDSKEEKDDTLIKHLIVLNKKEKIINLKSNEKKKKKKISELPRADVFKSTIYNNLLTENNSKDKIEDPILVLNNYKNYLEKEIVINNPEIQSRLEDIKNWGPYNPYCFIGKKKNLLFYKTMNPKQCIKLLDYIKKVKVKSKIGLNVENNEQEDIYYDDDDDIEDENDF